MWPLLIRVGMQEDRRAERATILLSVWDPVDGDAADEVDSADRVRQRVY